jgi:tight adherence protein C
MGLVVITFIAVFCLIVSAGLLLFYRAAMMKRLGMVLATRSEGTAQALSLRAFAPSAHLEAIADPFQKVLPRSPEEVSVVQKRLIRAGYRKDSYVNIFYGAKVLVPIILTVLATVTGAYQLGPLFVYAMTLGLGFLVPDFWLGNRISARQTEIRIGLPEALDLMVICIEAGLSLDQAILRTSDELSLSQPEISDELGLVNLEQRAGKARADAWKHMAERTDVDSIRALVALLVQVDQFGTSVSKALRTHADTLRTQRRQYVEEQAAKTTVKLVFPLVFFIFPSIFVVALGPAILTIIDAFDKYFSS